MAEIKVIMPQMGESVAEGTVAKWLKNPGERVEKDENILEISTDKIDVEVPAPSSGFLARILVEEGQTVEVGTVLAVIADSMEEVGETAEGVTEEKVKPGKKEPAARKSKAEAPAKAVAETESTRAEAKPGDKRRFYTPVVLRMAEEHGIDLENIKGTGMEGRITKKDVESYLKAMKEAPAPADAEKPALAPVIEAKPEVNLDGAEEVIPMNNVRKRTAEHMIRSKQTSAHVTSMHEVDITGIVRYRDSVKDEFQRENGFPLTYLAIITKVVVDTIPDFPLVNSSVDGENIITKRYVNIGIAVALPDDTLIVPVIHNATDFNVKGIARAIFDLAERARNRKLTLDDIQRGTFTITNHGSFGSVFGTPIINQPQVAILGTGAIRKMPVVVEGDAIAIRSMMYLSLTYDHRIIDGAYAGRFCRRIAEKLESWDPSCM